MIHGVSKNLTPFCTQITLLIFVITLSNFNRVSRNNSNFYFSIFKCFGINCDKIPFTNIEKEFCVLVLE